MPGVAEERFQEPLTFPSHLAEIQRKDALLARYQSERDQMANQLRKKGGSKGKGDGGKSKKGNHGFGGDSQKRKDKGGGRDKD